MGTNDLTDASKQELRSLAEQHPDYESFLAEVLRVAEGAWHDFRRDQSDEAVKSDPAADGTVQASDNGETQEVPQPAPQDEGTAPPPQTGAGNQSGPVEVPDNSPVGGPPPANMNPPAEGTGPDDQPAQQNVS